MNGTKSFREQVIEKFYAAFGEPEVSTVRSGNLYRWTLERGRYGISMYVTIDSPELPDIAHIMVSDSTSNQIEPVVTVTVCTMPEAESLIARIDKQWKSVRSSL